MKLDENDEKILKEFTESGYPPLAPNTAASLFQLYINGSTLREVHSLHPTFKYGAILHAAVKYKWEEQKDKYIYEMQTGIMQRMMQIQMESASFLADALSMTHAKHKEAMRRYLQTKDPKDLPEGFTIDSIQSYAKLIEALLKVTGQDAKKNIKVDFSNPLSSQQAESGGFLDLNKKPINPEQAEKLLAILANDDEKKK